MQSNEVAEQLDYIEKVKVLNTDSGRVLKYHVVTMGCQLNENDSEKIAGMLENMGYTKVEDYKDADIIVYNTCCVRENAEEKLFGKIGEVKRLREEKGTILAIGGCMMQEPHIVDKIKQSYPFIDIIFGTHTLHRLPENVYKILDKKKKIRDVLDIDGKVYEGLPIKRNSDKKASVTIMYGCNNFCTYCIVPYVRGRERSRKASDILLEIIGLAKNGYKEVTLLGQNVNSYMRSENEKNGFDYKNISMNTSLDVTKDDVANLCSAFLASGNNKANVEGIADENDKNYKEFEILKEKFDKEVNTFAKLLRVVEMVDGIEIIRFVSPHPKDFTDDVIDAIADSKKVNRILHLPLQSGSTNVLKIMNRRYTKEQYIELANKIKTKIPNVLFSTDIIVGFPGETKEDFEDTLDVVRKVNFEQVFMFIYSKREGTPGAVMENQIPEEIKHKRFDRLKNLVESQFEENNKKYIGKVERVLIEGYSKNNDKTLTARTDSNKVIILEADEEMIGKVVDVKIVSEHKWYLKGLIV